MRVGASRLSWPVVVGIGAAYSVFAALVSYWFTRGTGLSLWTLQPDGSATFPYIVAMNVVLWGGWAAFAPLVFAIGRRFRFERDGWRQPLAVHLTASLAVTSLHIVVVASGRVLLQRLWGVDAVWSTSVHDAFFRTLDFELPVYWALVGLQHAIDYHREIRLREVRAAQLETELVEAHLQALQRQLHPHFLFNTLHAISALVHRDPDKADAMIERLSDLLRVTLAKVSVQEVRLADELEYLRLYLDIEQVHFGNRLEIVYRIEPETLDAMVPNLILQPLAENAVRHGLEPRTARGRLTIEAAREAGHLVLRVADNGRGMSSTALSAANQGVGLSNTRSRLERLYRDRASLAFGSNRDRGVTVTVTLPFVLRGPHEDSSAGGRRSTDRAAATSLVAG